MQSTTLKIHRTSLGGPAGVQTSVSDSSSSVQKADMFFFLGGSGAINQNVYFYTILNIL